MKKELFRAYNVNSPSQKGSGLEQFSFSVYTNEVLGVFGNNYAGRHLVFQLLQGVLTPEKGFLTWKDESPVCNITSSLITEASVLNDSLTIWENISLLWSAPPGAGKGSRNARASLRVLFEDHGLEMDVESPVGNLTPLQKVFVELIAAQHKKTQLLLLDLNGIEGTHQEYQHLRSLLQKIKNESTSIVVFSYNVNAITYLCERAVILHGGRIIKNIKNLSLSSSDLPNCIQALYREPEIRLPKAASADGTLLEISGLDPGQGESVSFSLYSGEYTMLSSRYLDLFQTLSRCLLLGQQRQTCEIRYKGHPMEKLKKNKDVLFLDTRFLDVLVEEMSPLDNLCMGITSKVIGFSKRRNLMRCMEQEFYEWYGHAGLLRQCNCSALYRKDRAAINLFRLRYFKVGVIFCNDLSVHNDIVVYSLVQQALAELVEKGVCICMVTSDQFQPDGIASRYISLGQR